MVPNAAHHGHDIHHAADGRDAAADDGGQILAAGDADAGGIGGGGGLAHRAQVEAGAAAVEVQAHGHCHGDAQIGEDAVAEEQPAHHRQLLEEDREGRAVEGPLQGVADGHVGALPHPHEFTDVLAHAGAEDGEGQAGDVLVGPEGDGEEAEEQGSQRAGQEGGGDGDDHRQGGGHRRARQLLIVERRAQAQGAAHEHHALDAQVQVARLFGEDFAAGAVEQGRAVEDGGRDQVEQKGHFAASFLLWRSSAPRKTSL